MIGAFEKKGLRDTLHDLSLPISLLQVGKLSNCINCVWIFAKMDTTKWQKLVICKLSFCPFTHLPHPTLTFPHSIFFFHFSFWSDETQVFTWISTAQSSDSSINYLRENWYHLHVLFKYMGIYSEIIKNVEVAINVIIK